MPKFTVTPPPHNEVVGLTVLQIADRIRTDADAYRFMEELRWKGRPVCCHCDSENVAYMRPANGRSRATSSGSQSERRVWQCRDCRKQFSVLTGTVMHGTKVSVRIWVIVLFEMCASKNGVAAREIERKYGVCPRTAWHLMHRIREAMKSDLVLAPMEGVVMADETYFGGAERFKHASRRRTVNGPEGKTAVFTLIDKHRGESRSRVMPTVTGHTLRKVIADQVNMSRSILYTDQASVYLPVGREFLLHESVNHNEEEYVRGDVTTNHVEGFFSQLKRSLDGTHHHVSRQHLDRYLAEFDYRYSTRHLSDTERMERLCGQVGGKRLTYKLVAS